uniref:Uncharacterized protein n=1 Tax=Cacopsylla melanoneura TaxID=428564 RepID=A0A8D8YXK2_9HEMI
MSCFIFHSNVNNNGDLLWTRFHGAKCQKGRNFLRTILRNRWKIHHRILMSPQHLMIRTMTQAGIQKQRGTRRNSSLESELYSLMKHKRHLWAPNHSTRFPKCPILKTVPKVLGRRT